MNRRSIPDEWVPLLERRGLSSYRGLADATKLSVATVIRALNGEGDPEPGTVVALVEALGDDVERLLGRSVALGPYKPPDEAIFLNPRQRDALSELIRAMVPGAGGVVDLDSKRPQQPPVGGGQKAAHTGLSEGRQSRAQQDADATAPDPEGPEGGA